MAGGLVVNEKGIDPARKSEPSIMKVAAQMASSGLPFYSQIVPRCRSRFV